MRILAVGAHSDDVDEFSGGTLVRYVEAGHEVAIDGYPSQSVRFWPGSTDRQSGKLSLTSDVKST